jgi:hypothetical protein
MTRRDDSIAARWDAPIARGYYRNPPEPKTEAVISLRDRSGFTYERRVPKSGYVSQREAAALLALPVMTINRWVRSLRIKGKTRNGVSVIRLSDLYLIARERGLAQTATGAFLIG